MCYLLKLSVLRELSHRAITHTPSRSREPTKGLRVAWVSVVLLSAQGSSCAWASAEVTTLLSPFCPIQPFFHPKSLSKSNTSTPDFRKYLRDDWDREQC